jgi:hypothetical protein
MTSCRKCLNGALAETEIAPRQQPIKLRAGSITSSVMMPRAPKARHTGFRLFGLADTANPQPHRAGAVSRPRSNNRGSADQIARQVRIFDRVCMWSVAHPIDEAMRSPTGWSCARKTSS